MVYHKTYPNRPITIVYSIWSRNGDTLTRIIAKPVEKDLGQPIIIENKPGPQAIGMNYVLKSKPDGYNWEDASAAFSSSLLTYGRCPIIYWQIPSTLPHTINITSPLLLEQMPLGTNLKMFSNMQKITRKFTYARGRWCASAYLFGTDRNEERIKWVAVPFKSPAESVVACLEPHRCHTQSSVDILPHLQAGKLKLLLVLTDTRWPAYPNVPTVLESGFDFSAFSYGSINAPREYQNLL